MLRTVVAAGLALGVAFAAGLGPAELVPEQPLATASPIVGGTVSVEVDVVVYGATPSGVVAAVAAARGGASVALVESKDHVGGMMSNGLSWTDRGDIAVIGGLAREVFDRIEALEGTRYGRFAFQPKTAEAVFNSLIAEHRIALHLEQPLRERDGVAMEGSRITSITTVNGAVFSAAQFIDATYEGDLMAHAGVSYRIGREATDEYGESLAGVGSPRIVMQVPEGIDPGFPLLPAPGPIGSADERIQVSNFRACLSSDPANQAPFPMPDGYDASQFDIVLARFDSLAAGGQAPSFGWILHVDELANSKWDLAGSGQVSLELPGANYDYPRATYAEREAMEELHRQYNQGLLYFLANDPLVPAPIQSRLNDFGLCADEFVDNGNWPRQLYIREARRMVGEYVITQADREVTTSKPDIIGLASYPLDAHMVSRWIDEEGRLLVEGSIHAPGGRWAIPYRSLTPLRTETTNLLVSVAVSATKVGYAPLRMEPQFLIMGHAAGTAAAMAAESDTAVQDVPIDQLQARLAAAGAVLANP